MPNVYDIGVGAASNGLFTVEVRGASTLIQTLRAFSPDAERELRQTIRQAGQQVLNDAKGFAGGFAYSGDYAGSLGLKDLVKGVRIQSTDAGAGAIEFANAGAVYLRGPFRGRPIGTPPVPKPKALIKAKEEHEPHVIAAVQDALARACDRVRGA